MGFVRIMRAHFRPSNLHDVSAWVNSNNNPFLSFTVEVPTEQISDHSGADTGDVPEQVGERDEVIRDVKEDGQQIVPHHLLFRDAVRGDGCRCRVEEQPGQPGAYRHVQRDHICEKFEEAKPQPGEQP